jgi:hypothetical protein
VGQIGFSDSTPNPSRVQVGPKVAFDPWAYLTFGVNYSCFQKEALNSTTGEFETSGEHRLEFEVDPHYTLENHIQINLRNRWEHRWFIQAGGENDRTRHRLELVFPVKNAGPLADLFTSAEFFYDYDRGLNSEDRIIPLGLTFTLVRNVKLKAFYMWQPIQSRPGEWTQSNVFYTQLYLSL